MDLSRAFQDPQDHAETHYEPPQGPPGSHPETPRHRLRTLSGAQGTPKGAQGVPQERPMGTHNALKMPPCHPRGPSCPHKLARETSQRPWDTFQGRIFERKSGTNGLVTEKSYLSEAMAYLHV